MDRMVGSFTDFAPLLRNEKMQPFVHTEGALREVHEGITDLIKQLANEPSVGLFFVQQHVHKAVPVMVSLKAQMVDSTTEAEYVTQDVKDALNSLKSMKEIGPAVIARMIKTIDSSLPRLASLRPLKRQFPQRDGHPQGSLTRSGDFKDSLALQPSQMESNSPRSPNMSSVEISSVDAARSPYSSVDYQGQHMAQLSEYFSDHVSLEAESTRSMTLEGEYTGYVRTIVDSALERASRVANVARWNSSKKATKSEILSTRDGDLLPHITAQIDTDPRFSVRNVLGTAFNRASSFGKTMASPSSGASGSEENSFVARNMQEGQDTPAQTPDKSLSSSTLKEVPGYRNPGYYLRSALESAMQTAGNVSREGSKLLYQDGPEASLTEEKTTNRWNWLQAPNKTLRSLSKKPEKYPIKDDLIVTDPKVENVILDQDSSSQLQEDSQELLNMELESFEEFAAERAAKLEEWLGDTEGDDEKEIK